jgi:hypothetical protein
MVPSLNDSSVNLSPFLNPGLNKLETTFPDSTQERGEILSIFKDKVGIMDRASLLKSGLAFWKGALMILAGVGKTVWDMATSPVKFGSWVGGMAKDVFVGMWDMTKTLVKDPNHFMDAVWEFKNIVLGDIGTFLSGDYLNLEPDRRADGKLDINTDPTKPGIALTPGMKNTEDTSSAMRKNASLAFDSEALLIPNETHWGGFGDAIQIVFHELFGVYDRPSRLMAEAIKQTVEEKGVAFVVGHSQGTKINERALAQLSLQIREKVYFYGAGGETLVSKEKYDLAGARNTWNRTTAMDKDWIPAIGNNLNPMNIKPGQQNRLWRDVLQDGGKAMDGSLAGENTWVGISVQVKGNKHKFDVFYLADFQKWAENMLGVWNQYLRKGR